jgi:uncharacterized protein YbbC (DUF1343 family)
MLWRDTSLRWPVPSPNLRDPDAALLYPGVALLEASNVSVGRGTDHPFELVGAPWVSGKALAAALRGEAIQGVSIEQATFTPSASKHAGARCHGVRLRVTDGPRLQSLKLGIALAHHLRRLHAGAFHPAQLLTMLGDRDSFSALERGASVADVMAVWQVELDAFRKRRQRHLLY